MNEKGDIILEYLADIGVAEPLQVIYFNLQRRDISFSKSTVRRRLTRLNGSGMVRVARESGTYYEITERGEEYLAGEHKPPEIDFDAGEVEDLDPDA